MRETLRQLRWLFAGTRATWAASGLSGRIVALCRRGRYEEAYQVTIRQFDLLAKVPREFQDHPVYMSTFIGSAVQLDDLCDYLNCPPPCAQLREALRLMTEGGLRFNKRTAHYCEDVQR